MVKAIEKRNFLQKKITPLDNQIGEPELFFLFIMSHGGENGIIYTDHISSQENNHTSRAEGTKVTSMAAFESYTTKEVFSALRSNLNLKNCPKVVVIQVIFVFWQF